MDTTPTFSFGVPAATVLPSAASGGKGEVFVFGAAAKNSAAVGVESSTPPRDRTEASAAAPKPLNSATETTGADPVVLDHAALRRAMEQAAPPSAVPSAPGSPPAAAPPSPEQEQYAAEPESGPKPKPEPEPAPETVPLLGNAAAH
eukprot:COSAG02_NODE_17717_length_985_cov_1.706546_1_plen_145_part_10